MSDPKTKDAASRKQRGIRIWPAILIALACGLAVAGNTIANENDAQRRFLVNASTGILGAALLLIWVVTLSRLGWKIRVTVLAASVLLVTLGFATLRITDVRGDLVPIFTWRWSEPPPLAVPEKTSAVPRRQDLPGLADFPQFLGPSRDGRAGDLELKTDWELRPPRELWRIEIGAGYSGFAVAGRHAVTQEQRGEHETVVCYDIASGAVLWAHRDQTRYESTLGGVGPRATPTVTGAMVVTYGATGILNCLDLKTGAVHWARNVVGEIGGKIKEWGMSTSPLVFDGRVVVGSGGQKGDALAAYDLASGEPVWTGGDDRHSYSSPALVSFSAGAQIVVLNSNSVAGHDPATGTTLWRHDWPGSQPKVPPPLVLPDDRIVVSSGYGVGAASFQITPASEPHGDSSTPAWTVTERWRTKRMKSKFANMVYRRGHIYGLDDGILASVDASSGERNWKGGRYGHGQLLLVGDVLLVTTETGDVVLVAAEPQRHDELARTEVFADKTWNPPALAGRYLVLRNHREAVCLEMAVRE